MKKFFLATLAISISFLSFSQNKRIVEDYNTLKKELITIKTEAEGYAVDIKNNWKNDTLKTRGRVSYIKLPATIDGIVETFEGVIKKPKNLTSAVKTAIDDDLLKVRGMMNEFSQFYTNGMTNQGGIPPETASLAILQGGLQIGLGVFNDLKKLMQGDREEVAKQFVEQCKFKRWEQL
jgi:hypothetical protein